MADITVQITSAISAQNGGLCISRGIGRHPERTIDSHELIFVIEGELGIQEEGQPFTVKAGEILIIFPSKRHGGTVEYPDNLKYYWIHFDFLKDKLIIPIEADHTIQIPRHVKVKNQTRLIELFRWFLDAQEHEDLEKQEANLLINLMLVEVWKSKHRVVNNDLQKELLADKVKQYIKIHFHKDISTSSIAHALCYNPDYLGRVFKEVFRETITDCIHDHRTCYAKKLLLNSVYNIDEIGMHSGFIDPCYFRRIFKKREGIPPNVFRKLHSRVHVNTE
jgi:AraC-like DNA-binding protein